MKSIIQALIRSIKPDFKKPYPNEHSCRIRSPSDFQKKSFRRIVRGKLHIIIGRLKGKTTTTTQAYRYPTKNWSKKEAQNHCKKHKGKFHPAG